MLVRSVPSGAKASASPWAMTEAARGRGGLPSDRRATGANSGLLPRGEIGPSAVVGWTGRVGQQREARGQLAAGLDSPEKALGFATDAAEARGETAAGSTAFARLPKRRRRIRVSPTDRVLGASESHPHSRVAGKTEHDMNTDLMPTLKSRPAQERFLEEYRRELEAWEVAVENLDVRDAPRPAVQAMVSFAVGWAANGRYPKRSLAPSTVIAPPPEPPRARRPTEPRSGCRGARPGRKPNLRCLATTRAGRGWCRQWRAARRTPLRRTCRSR